MERLCPFLGATASDFSPKHRLPKAYVIDRERPRASQVHRLRGRQGETRARRHRRGPPICSAGPHRLRPPRPRAASARSSGRFDANELASPLCDGKSAQSVSSAVQAKKGKDLSAAFAANFSYSRRAVPRHKDTCSSQSEEPRLAMQIPVACSCGCNEWFMIELQVRKSLCRRDPCTMLRTSHSPLHTQGEIEGTGAADVMENLCVGMLCAAKASACPSRVTRISTQAHALHASSRAPVC